ncbi:transcriptional regulator [Streptomyces fructofermentans]|nr:transcriptional regulator [Streptomyces fructofermentans]
MPTKASGPGPGTPAEATPAPAASTPAAAPDPSSGPAAAPGGGPTDPSPERAETPSPGPRKLWYGRRGALTAAVATALLAALGGLSALASGNSAASGDDRASGRPAAKTAGGPHGSPTPSASPSATHGKSSGRPSPNAPGNGDGSAKPSTSASPGVSGTPLAWTMNSQLWDSGCNHDYVIDKAPEQVPPPPAPQDALAWARSQGAVHGGQTLLEIAVQGKSDTAVVLRALRVRVVGRADPVQGTVYATGQGCGSDLAPRTFVVDLDKDRPIARPMPGNDSGVDTPPMPMPYRVSANDPEVLLVDARTAGCDCRWYLELDWSSQGRTGTERIDDNGRPFRTSGTAGLPHYWYAHRGWTRLTS